MSAPTPSEAPNTDSVHQAERSTEGVRTDAGPPPGLLMSMAMRSNHALGLPGYYDQFASLTDGLTHAQRLEATLRHMRQLWEEVAGVGFYRPEKEDYYAALAKLCSENA